MSIRAVRYYTVISSFITAAQHKTDISGVFLLSDESTILVAEIIKDNFSSSSQA